MQSRRELIITIVLKNIRYKILNHKIFDKKQEQKARQLRQDMQ